MRRNRVSAVVAAFGLLGLAGCGGDSGESNAEPTTVTVTAPAVTVTPPAVTVTAEPVAVTPPAVPVTAEPVTVTPPAVTVTPPAVTETAPAVTVTAEASEGRGGTAPSAGSGLVVDVLVSLPVKGRAPKTGFDREEFGASWTDDVDVQGGRNGCDTRNDVLRRDLDDLAVEAGTNGCVALTGTLPDPYTGEDLPFVRGEDSGSQIHIDHLVSLNNAWQTGAGQLSAEQRQNFANDPLNLWAVQGAANQQKSDGDAATWLPPNRGVHCDLIAHQIAVKAKYGLWVTSPEADAMHRVLSGCPGQELPTDGQAATPATNY